MGATWELQRVECFCAFLDLDNEDRNDVLNQIVTRNKTWVYHYELESKQDYAVT